MKKITIDMGYRGELEITIEFTDQNNITHSRTLELRVFSEKPTCLTIETAGDDGKTIYATTSERKE